MPKRFRSKGLKSKVKRNTKAINKLEGAIETKAEDISLITDEDANTTSYVAVLNAVAQGLK